MSNTFIRSAVIADAATIAEFQIAMALETENLVLDREICSAGVRAVFDDPSRGSYFIAERDGRVIASTLVTYEWSDWRNGVVWWIHSVYVVPGERGSGVFAQLYRHLQSLARESGVRGIRLYVDKTNTAAQRVYEKLGMNGEHYHLYEWMIA
ncbi:MAG: GNAT family N-acetyltransferase [Acidobacteriota bacterium]|nr:MAG: GNAT family N-acetyltransferase [Acidobacteriota bacterium]